VGDKLYRGKNTPIQNKNGKYYTSYLEIFLVFVVLVLLLFFVLVVPATVSRITAIPRVIFHPIAHIKTLLRHFGGSNL
jgi:hypothetical protein